MNPADLSSLADDLEKRCENIDQLDFLIALLAWISGKLDESFDLLPNDFAVLADHFYELADKFAHFGLENDEYGEADTANEIAEDLRHLHAILASKYCKAVGRA